MCKTHRPSSFSSSSVHGDISNSFASSSETAWPGCGEEGSPHWGCGRWLYTRIAWISGCIGAETTYVSPGTCMHAMACQWRSEDNFHSWFSLPTVGTRDCTRVVRLAWQASLLTEPPHWPETSLFLRKSKFALGSKHCVAASPSSSSSLPPFD